MLVIVPRAEGRLSSRVEVTSSPHDHERTKPTPLAAAVLIRHACAAHHGNRTKSEVTELMPEVSPEGRGYSNRVPLLDALRGAAAFAVCFYHLTNKNADFLSDGSLVKWLGSFGFLGVEAFFVISGFVIPYALFVKKYKLEAYPRFILKRLVRLDPPYLACILLVIALETLSSLTPGYRGIPYVPDWPAIAAHLGYANAFLGYEWLSPVFWTLAIEFQYYLAMGLLFPFISGSRKSARIGAVVGLGSLGFLSSNPQFLIHWLPLFALGISVFQFRAKLLDRRECGLLVVLLSLATCITHGFLIAFAATVCACGILLAERLANYRIWRPLEWIGVISYSFYLLHVPIGGRVVNLAERFTTSDGQRYLVIILATLVALAASCVFYRFIEAPSRSLSARMSYFGTRQAIRKPAYEMETSQPHFTIPDKVAPESAGTH